MSRWLYVHPSAGVPRLRLLCFPYAGGSASIFQRWPRFLPPDVEVCAVQLPGRALRIREAPITEWPALVSALTSAWEPFLDRPFALFGHSLGATIAFEVARAVRRQTGRAPERLYVSGRAAPHLPSTTPAPSDLTDDAFLQLLEALEGTPPDILENRELMALLLPTLRADFHLAYSYHYTGEPPLACPVMAFGGADDPNVAVGDLDAWAQHTQAAFERVLFPGGHFFLQTVQHDLLAALAQTLA